MRSALFWKVSVYYGVLIISILVLVDVVGPAWTTFLPLGGPQDFSGDFSSAKGTSLGEQVLTMGQSGMFLDNAGKLFSALMSSLIVMIPLRWVYLENNRRRDNDNDYDIVVAAGLLLLPLVITAIVFFIKFSLPLAFALVGILGGMRIRTEPKDQSETHFTFVSIGVGLAVGAGYLAIALVLALFFALTALIATYETNGSQSPG